MKRVTKTGEEPWDLAPGRDDRPAVSEGEAKSISHEPPFEQDIADMEVLRA